VEIILTSTSLFENQHLHVIKNEVEYKKLLVKGDRDQCLRVFNNVLKNAMHAIEEVAQPSIIISAQRKGSKVIISITDNGCGIDDSLKSKIFTPNFTTKSTGSGLGLAMVKNCMLGFGGDIHFQSQLNQGSTFYLEFLIEEKEINT
jgi:signal transduction histidine kinase